MLHFNVYHEAMPLLSGFVMFVLSNVNSRITVDVNLVQQRPYEDQELYNSWPTAAVSTDGLPYALLTGAGLDPFLPAQLL